MHPSRCRALLTLALGALFSGCGIRGGETLYAARPAYNEAIARSSTEQLLLNLVRMKFRDAPVFLQVGSIATQYTFTASAGVNPTIDSGDVTMLGSVGVLRTEQPTITFSPLQGEQFAKQFMSNIPVETLALLSTSGWSIERILRCCVQSINGVQNAPTAAGPTPERAPEFRDFYRLSQLMRSLQDRRELLFDSEFASDSRSKGDASGVRIRIVPTMENRELLEEMRMIFARAVPAGAVKRTNSLSVGTFGAPALPASIRIVPRSLFATLFYLSQGLQTPPRDVEAGRITVTRDDAGNRFDWSELTNHLMTIHWSDDPPTNAYVTIRYRGTFYYIADDDLPSKATLMLLEQLVSLQSGANPSVGAPALTLAVGR